MTDINVEQTLKDSAVELEFQPVVPRSEHHIGYLTQILKDGRVTQGEIASDEPVGPKATLGWALHIGTVLSDPTKLMAIGLSFKRDPLILYRITPRYCVREFYTQIDKMWSPAHMVNPIVAGEEYRRLAGEELFNLDVLVFAIYTILLEHGEQDEAV